MTPSNQKLSGRVAVVTGASSGIGEATAKRLAASGATVAVLARRADRLDRLVAAELGTADVLINNAGVMLPAPVDEAPLEQWQRQIDLNISGLMNVIGAFVPQLIDAAAAGGVADLVNTSSIAAQNIFPTFAVYSGTKAYVTHMSRTLRAELGSKNVRVSAVEPGIVGTELQGHVTDAAALEWLEDTRQQIDWLAPEDVADAIEFLVSQPARVNVQQLTIMPTRQAS